jgi:DNA-binding response OmpR family regulator
MSSIISGENVLFIGEETSQIKNLENVLSSNGMHIHNLNCESVTNEKIQSLGIGIIILDYLNKNSVCNSVLGKLEISSFKNKIPTIFLINEDAEMINEALSHGAADYITSDEATELSVQKVRTVLGQENSLSESSAIDITPIEVSLKLSGAKVFVVEDDPLLRNLLSLRFDKSSFPYEFSTDGKNAISAMRQFKPNIVILDLMLPGRSGFDVLTEIKNDEQLKNIPVIVFSNKDGQEDRKKADELGAAGFYVKAMTDLSELIELIEDKVK